MFPPTGRWRDARRKPLNAVSFVIGAQKGLDARVAGLVQDAVVTLRRHRLLFGEEEDCGANRVEYDSATDRLTLGCYGLFLPDDATHPAAEEFETPVE